MPTPPNDSSPAFVSRIQQALSDLRSAIEDELRIRSDYGSETEPTAQSSDPGALRASLQVIDSATGSSEILSRLLEQASLFAERVGLFQVQGGLLKGWSSIGFGAMDAELRKLETPLTGPWAEVTRSGCAARLGSDAVGEACKDLRCPPGQHALLVPFVLRGKVDAVLYADQLSSGSTLAPDELQILCHCAAQALDLAPLKEGTASALRRSDDESDAASAQPPPQTLQRDAPPAAVSAPAEPVPSAAETQPTTAHREPPAPEKKPQLEEIFKSGKTTSAAQQGTPGGVVQPPSDLEGPGSAFDSGPAGGSNPDLTAEAKAQKLAGFLVGEIKLYNEARLVEAREAGNIYSHLADDIELARNIYNERVESSAAKSGNYFDDEILRVLANGDPSLLGR